MSATVTLFYHGSEPGGLGGIDLAFRFGDSYAFPLEMAEILLAKQPQNWWSREQYDQAMDDRAEAMIKKGDDE